MDWIDSAELSGFCLKRISKCGRKCANLLLFLPYKSLLPPFPPALLGLPLQPKSRAQASQTPKTHVSKPFPFPIQVNKTSQ